jgi:pimeloyl-ACP methyl ester carboxylesterase
MTRFEISAGWEQRVAALWSAFDTMEPLAFLAAMQALAAELPDQHSRALFELASAHDYLGEEAEAAPLYASALAGGLDGSLHRQATIQYASTLRNLGRAADGLDLLRAEQRRTSDELDTALAAFEALLLADLGRDREGLGVALTALATHLPRYRRSVSNYAAALMPFSDDDLAIFVRDGALPLPADAATGYLDHDGVRIWHASCGTGPTVILLHGGLGNAGNWGHQIEPLRDAGYSVVAIDTRGHGRSTHDDQPYTYQLLASDVLALMNGLGIAQAALVGWSDGACTALILADQHPERVSSVFFFGCNMDPSGALPFVPTPVIDNCFARHKADYAALSATPEEFDTFVAAVGRMQRTEPNYTPADLAAISVPVTIVHSEGDEFIRSEHAAYLAETIPVAKLVLLPGVTHFAPLQRPALFNAALLGSLAMRS